MKHYISYLAKKCFFRKIILTIKFGLITTSQLKKYNEAVLWFSDICKRPLLVWFQMPWDKYKWFIAEIRSVDHYRNPNYRGDFTNRRNFGADKSVRSSKSSKYAVKLQRFNCSLLAGGGGGGGENVILEKSKGEMIRWERSAINFYGDKKIIGQ